ncbi:MAG: DUF3775 domain-containing protein [Gemmatimonas sp.]
MPMPSIATEKVCFIVVMAREIHAKVEPVLPGGSYDDGTDTGFREILEDFANDGTYQELREFIVALDDDEKAELLALMWIGRGDFDGTQWEEALAEARGRANAREPDYIIGTPLVSDFLEEGLAAFELSCVDFEKRDL